MIKQTPEAIKNDKELGLPLIEVAKIHLDHEFNCRGLFNISECLSLAEDLANRGLQNPIIIRPLRDVDKDNLKNEKDIIAKGFQYIVIAGHRRLASYKLNEAVYIPCILKDKFIDVFAQHDLNAIENIHRQDLNLWQEANAIRHYWGTGWKIKEVAERINKSAFWVQQRYQLLEMPPEVQQAAKDGFLIASDIKDLAEYKNDMNELLRLAGILRDKRKKGEKIQLLDKVETKKQLKSKKQRSKEEMFKMLEQLQKTFKHLEEDKEVPLSYIFTKEGNSLATRVLAWAAGEISSNDLYDTLEDLTALLNIEYERPGLNKHYAYTT